MKRILICFAIISVILCGCNRTTQKIMEPVNFYYCTNSISFNTESGVIAQETREADGFRDITDLLSVYLKGPLSDSLSCPFPAGVEVISVDTINSICTVVLSEQFAALTGLDLVVACNCLGMTLMDLDEINSVEIKAVDSELNGQKSVLITENSFLLFDSSASEPTPPQE